MGGRERTTGQKVSRNAFANVGFYILTLPISLIQTSVMWIKLGGEMWGVWLVAASIANMAAMVDMGISTALCKYTAEYHARKEHDQLNRLINSAFVFYAVGGAIVVAALLLGINGLLTLFFAKSQVPTETIRLVIFLFLVSLYLNLIFTAYTSVIRGLQRYDWSNLLTFIFVVVTAATYITLLLSGYGITEVALANLLLTGASIVARMILAKAILPQLRINPLLCRVKMLLHIWKYCSHIFVSTIASRVHMEVDKLLLSFFMGPAYAGYYGLAAMVCGQIRNVPSRVIEPIMPAASELSAQKDTERISQLYFRSQKYNMYVIFPLFVCAMVYAVPFAEIWLQKAGNELSYITFALRVLLIPYLVNIMTGPGFFILNGIGKPQYAMRSSLLGAISNVLLSVVFGYLWGYTGVLLGTVISMVSAAAYFEYLFHRVCKISFLSMVRNALTVPLATSAVVGVTAFVVLRLIPIKNIPELLAAGIMFLAAYATLTSLLRFFNNEDRQTFDEYLPHWLARVLAPGTEDRVRS